MATNLGAVNKFGWNIEFISQLLLGDTFLPACQH